MSCGEVSGDLYAADLIQELLKEDALFEDSLFPGERGKKG